MSNLIHDPIIDKNKSYANDIIFIDGLWGTGKSIIAPIISGMDRVEKQKIEHIYEYICILLDLGKVSPDAAQTLLKIYADLSQYNNLLGREVNLRLSDDSGILNNPGSMKYIYRLLISDQDNVGNFITNNNVALNIMSHMVAAVSSPLFEAYGDRLKLVEMVRHPMYMVRHWYSYLGRFDDEKEFTISFSYKGEKLPWYSAEWKDKYLNLSLMDRCLASISYMYSRTFDVLDAMGNKDQSVLIIPFEEFVIRPNDVLNRLEIFLGRKCGRDVKRTLKKQKVPRRKILDGKGYSAYGWRPGVENSEKKEYVEQLKWIKKEGSTNCVQSFLDLVYLYDTRWPSELSKYGPMKGM